MMNRPKNEGLEPKAECWIRGRTLLKALELTLLAITAIGTVMLIALTLILVFHGG